MNSNQTIILTVAVVIFLMTILSPLWLYENHYNSTERSAGHHLFNRPPEIKSNAEMRRIFSISEKDNLPHNFSVKKDKLRLFGEWSALLFLMIGSLPLAADRKTPVKLVLGVLFTTIGVLFSAVVILTGCI